jgi:hypothetical protein
VRLALVGLLVGFASFGTVQKYAGTAAAIAYVAVVTVVVPIVWPRVAVWTGHSLRGRHGYVVAAVVLVVLAAALAVVYPHANTHTPGQGSDRDDAANIGALRLLHGEYPYGPHTYLGLPISQLPGALILAAPFAGISSSAWGNVFWLAVLMALLAASASWGTAAIAVAAAFVIAPALPREYLTGGDLIANTIYVAAALWLVYRYALSRWWWLAAAALGLTLASRANFVFVLIPLGVALYGRGGLRAALPPIGVASASALALTLPVLAKQAGRDALSISNHLSSVGTAGEAAVLLAAAALAIWLARRERDWSLRAIYWQAALVQALFPLALVVHTSLDAGRLDGSELVSGYGVPAILFALLGTIGAHRLAWPAIAGGGNAGATRPTENDRDPGAPNDPESA